LKDYLALSTPDPAMIRAREVVNLKLFDTLKGKTLR
jgi:hypothetical protein